MTFSRRGFCALIPTLAVRGQGGPAPTLAVRVTASGKPAAARVYITGQDGSPHLCTGALTFNRRHETHSVVDGAASAALPAGRYTIRAEKGAEFAAVEQTVTVPPAGQAQVMLDVPRLFDMNAHGWYSGDMHIHRPPEEMPLLVRAEDLNVAPVITRHVGGERPAPPPYPERNEHPVDAMHIVTLQNQEVERLRTGPGAILLLNTPEALESDVPLQWPMDVDFCRRARRMGGFIDGEKPIWKNVPVNAAFGVLDAVGVVNNHFHPHAVLMDAEIYGSMERDEERFKTPAGFADWMMELYYRLLNCGFRLPVSAGSASGIMPSWPGYERVHVHLSGEFSVAQWFRDLKAGRSVATNGPLLRLTLEGKPPGIETAWKQGAEARIDIQIHSQHRIDRVEIVYNGSILRTLPAGDATFRERAIVKLPAPGWLAVRCFEPVTDTVRYAHTSPFYFTQNGKRPVVRADAVRWAETVGRIAAAVPTGEYPSPDRYRQARAIFQEAQEIYRKLAAQAATP